jgi:hypothetical protein
MLPRSVKRAAKFVPLSSAARNLRFQTAIDGTIDRSIIQECQDQPKILSMPVLFPPEPIRPNDPPANLNQHVVPSIDRRFQNLPRDLHSGIHGAPSIR